MSRFVIVSHAFRSNCHHIIDSVTGKCVTTESNYEQAEYLCGTLNRAAA